MAADNKLAADNKAVVRRWFDEVINGRRPEAVDEIFASEYVHHGNLGESMRRDEVKRFAAALLAAYPDRRSTVLDLIAEDDRVAARWTSTGHRQGSYLGQPATGEEDTISGVWFVRVAGGRAVEGWEVVDIDG